MLFSRKLTETIAAAVAVLAFVGGVVAYAVQLQGRIDQLEKQVQSLASSSAATALALTEISKKPVNTINSTQKKCIELAQQANSRMFNDGMATEAGEHVAQRAIALMRELGCGSMVR